MDFFDEMWKIIGQIDDFGRFFNNFCNFGVFIAKNQKYPKMTVLKKWNWKKYVFFLKDRTTYFKYHIYHSYSIDFMILLICFVICNV